MSTATGATDDVRLSAREDAERHLRALAGPSAELRDDQWPAIEALVVDRRRVLRRATHRVGQVGGLLRRHRAAARRRGAGPTVIVSPLLALMRNQIDAAERAGIRALTINSANLDEWEQITAEIHAGEVDVLLVSPERLNNPDFRDNVLPRLAAELRPARGRRGALHLRLGPRLPPRLPPSAHVPRRAAGGVPVLATTATANARVTADVAEQLGDARRSEVLVLRGALDRESLHLAVVPLPTPAQRLAWLAEHLDGCPAPASSTP